MLLQKGDGQMNAANQEKQQASLHSVQMNRRRHACITGVTDVCSFHETEIVLKVDTGLMFIGGENLHIGKLLLDDGKLDVEGQIDSLIYEKPRGSVRRLFGWKNGK